MTKKRENPTKASTSRPTPIIPGEIILGEGDIIALYGRQTVELTVSNTGDRPIKWDRIAIF